LIHRKGKLRTFETDRSAGARLRGSLASERPLQLAGAINAYCALLAEQAGFRALYLSGAGVANASLGLPDLALTTLGEVLEDLRRITGATELPVLVDADTGWGSALMAARAVRELERAGAAGCHIEDQVQAKRCGHRPGKVLAPVSAFVNRLKAAADARIGADFVLVARTDALGVEGLEPALERACRYVEAGADMIFLEAATTLEDYQAAVRRVGAPVLANITEFGKTPLFSLEELREAGVAGVIYPLSAFRAMSKAALRVYETIRRRGTQRDLIEAMQTREELYAVLGYREYEEKADRFLAEGE
jgi:methylisocitrate lyase